MVCKFPDYTSRSHSNKPQPICKYTKLLYSYNGVQEKDTHPMVLVNFIIIFVYCLE